MLSTVTRPENDPHDVLEISPDIVVAAARAEKNSPTLAPDAAIRPSDPPAHMESAASAPRVDTTFRAAAADNARLLGKRGPIGTWALRTFIGLLLAVSSAVVAAAWQVYGDTARQMIANWTPHFALASSTPALNGGPSEQPASAAPQPASPPQTAAAEQSAAPPASSVPASQATAPAAAAPSPDSTQLLQSMAHDLSTLGQQIGELKASIEQLRSNQEQLSREIAKASETKASEQNLRPRTPAPPLRPAAATVHKPKPTYYYPPAQTAAVPPPRAAPAPVVPQAAPPIPPAEPPQATAQPDGEPVVRPPMPVR